MKLSEWKMVPLCCTVYLRDELYQNELNRAKVRCIVRCAIQSKEASWDRYTSRITQYC